MNAKRKVFTPQEIENELGVFPAELKEGADRATMLMAAAYLDAALETLLRAALLQEEKPVDRMFASGGALESFGIRADMAHLMGLIGPTTRANIECIRKIRNYAAHNHKPVGFDDQPVVDLCRNARFVGEPKVVPIHTTTRDRFIFVAMMVAWEIVGITRRQERAQERQDPDLTPIWGEYKPLPAEERKP